VIRTAALIAAMLMLATTAFAVPAPPAPVETAMGDSLDMDWSRIPEYRIVPGDQLAFNFGPQGDVMVTSDLVRIQRVRPDGRISVFPIGDVVAAGRTVRELEDELVRLLAGELRRPRVTIEVTEVAGNEVHILGRVERPGSYKAGPYMTVSQAVAAAGGLKDDASPNNILVFHRDGARTAKVVGLRLGDALKHGKLEADLPLGRFDIVFVPRSRIGDINLFSKQFFADNLGPLQFGLLGWELFHLERVYPIPITLTRQ
jgi:protein involved in polysaccharide export with SLBB domain